MARLASEAKGGYFPTPPEEMALAVARIKVKGGSTVNLLDPVAGTGVALKQMADHISFLGALPVTYGVELENSRADEAKENLDYVLKGGYEEMRMTHKSVSCMYLNPPYDERFGMRTENIFFRNLTEPDKYLQDRGLLMFCIPQAVLKDCSYLLAGRLEDIRVYRFTDKNYPAFKQVMVYGYRRKVKAGPESQEIRKWLQKLGESGPEALPALDEPDGYYYQIPPADKKVALFRGSYFDPAEVARDIDSSPAWSSIEDLLLPPNVRHDTKLQGRFILPPKEMMLAVAIVSGAAGGNMGGDHLLVGITKKVANTTFEEYEDGRGRKEITTERHVTVCRVFTPQGVHILE